MSKSKLYCATAIACVALICAAAVVCFAINAQQETIREQQYALNMQYAGLLDYVANSEITTETTTYEADSGDNGNAIVGDGNSIVGGDVNGNS